MHIVAVPNFFIGHLMPMLRLVEELLKVRGHKVTLIVSEFENHKWMPVAKDLGAQIFLVKDGNSMELVNSEINRDLMPYKLLSEKFEPHLQNIISKLPQKPDLILCDFSVYCAQMIANKLHIPLVIIYQSPIAAQNMVFKVPQLGDAIKLGPLVLYPVSLFWDLISIIAPIFRSFKKDFETILRYKPLMIFTSFPGLELPYLLPPYIKLTGPLVPLAENLQKSIKTNHSDLNQWLEQKQRQNIKVAVISFGSFFRLHKWQIDTLYQAFANLDFAVVWSLPGDQKKYFQNNLPPKDRFWISKWIPQQEVLAHGSVCLFITHCGYGALTEAILAGVPMICLPYFGDEPSNAELVVKQQIGVILHLIPIQQSKGLDSSLKYFEIPRFKIDQVVQCIQKVESNFKLYKENLQKLALYARAAGGCAEACNLIERVFISKGSDHLYKDMEFATKPFKIGIMGVFYALIILLSIKVLSMMF